MGKKLPLTAVEEKFRILAKIRALLYQKMFRHVSKDIFGLRSFMSERQEELLESRMS